MSKRTVGILTGGGDCPGLNAVIRGVAKSAIREGLGVIGFYDGFLGLIEKRFIQLDSERVSGILTHGGTILGTSNKDTPFAHIVKESSGIKSVDVSAQCMELYRDLGLEALICVGGDGTMSIAGKLAELGANVVGVPKTIDKDLMETDSTFGFDSALTTATEAIDKLHTTADAHQRVMVIEVMGRNAGWLALESAIAGGGDVVLIPELPYQIEEVAAAVRRRSRYGKRFSLVIVSEGSAPAGGSQTFTRDEYSPDPVKLGGCSHNVAREIEQLTGIDTRVTVLGHLQRGGTPTPLDRLLATRFAVKAMELITRKEYNQMVALKGDAIEAVEITKVMGKQRLIPKDSPLITTAKAVGMSFGVVEG